MLDLPKWAETWVKQGCPKCGTKYFRHNVSRIGVLLTHPFRGKQHFFFEARCMTCRQQNDHQSEHPFTVRDIVECFSFQYQQQEERKARRRLLARRRRAKLRKPIGDAELRLAKKALQRMQDHDELLRKLKVKAPPRTDDPKSGCDEGRTDV